MKALTWHGCYLGQSFKAQGSIHEIAQNESCRLRFVTQKQSCSLVEECSSERGVALDSGNDCLLEIARKRHGYTSFASWRYFRPDELFWFGNTYVTI